MVEVTQFISGVAATASEDDQIVREAVRDAMFLYQALPTGARRALRALSALATDEERRAMAEAVAPVIARIGFHAARRAGAEAAGRAYPNGRLETEDDVEAEAVRLTRSARPNLG